MPTCHQRVVVLGASNVARGMSAIAERARATDRAPHEILVAAGRGRSYGIRSRLLGRTLPGIRHSRLWAELERRPANTTRALLTDVGNDLLYGIEVAQIAEWVNLCLQRLGAAGANTIVTTLPLARLQALTPRAFAITKRVFFPARHLEFDAAQRSIQTLDDHLRRAATAHGAHVVTPKQEWYGVDPIHIRPRSVREAWSDLLHAWGPRVHIPPTKLVEGLRLGFRGTADGNLFGLPLRGRPFCWPDGSSLRCL